MPTTPAQAGQLSSAAAGLAAAETNVVQIVAGEPRVATQGAAAIKDIDAAQISLAALGAVLANLPAPEPDPPPPPPPGASSVWNPARAAGKPTLSGGDIFVSFSDYGRIAGKYGAVQGQARRDTVKITKLASNGHVGLITNRHDWNAASGTKGYVGGTPDSFGWRSDTGGLYHAGAVVKTGPKWKVGDEIGIELDAAADIARFYLNGTKAFEFSTKEWDGADVVNVAIGFERAGGAASITGAPVASPGPVPADPPPPPPAPPPAPTGNTLGVSVENGNSRALIDSFVAMMGGKKPAYVWQNCDDRSWQAHIDSLNGGISGGYGPAARGVELGGRVWYTVPIVVQQPGYAGGRGHYYGQAISGVYDGNWRAAARSLARAYGAKWPIVVRLASEPNGSWFVYGVAKGEEPLWVEAWRRCVGVFREVEKEFPGTKFLFDYNPQPGWDEGGDCEKMYPGKAWTDIISGDFYCLSRYAAVPTNEFNRYLNHRWGLRWIRDLAASEGLKTAYPEWGVDTDAPEYIHLCADFFATNTNLLMQCYWMRNDDGGALTNLLDGSKPKARAAYVARFGG